MDEHKSNSRKNCKHRQEKPLSMPGKTSARKQSSCVKKQRDKSVVHPASATADLLLFAKQTSSRATEQIQDNYDRRCDYCSKVANAFVLMHCTACRRVYHAQCLVRSFKPFVDTNVPVEYQIRHLQHNAPERRGTIFRCASCKATFIDIYEKCAHLWDCTCPTCVNPEKVVNYRRRKLVAMANESGQERQNNQGKGNNNPSRAGAAKTPPVLSSAYSSLYSGRTRSSSHVIEEQKTSVPTTPRLLAQLRRAPQKQKRSRIQNEAEVIDVVASAENCAKQTTELEHEDEAEPMEVDGRSYHQESIPLQLNALTQHHKNLERQLHPNKSLVQCTTKTEEKQLKLANRKKTLQSVVAESNNADLQLQQSSKVLNVQQKHVEQAKGVLREPVAGPEQHELKGDELVASVRMREEANGHWLFPVMCSRTASLRESGIMKTGMFIWDPKKYGVIRCDCCEKVFSCGDFVHHTDSNLVKNPRSSDEDPTSFIFVQHRDGEQYTLLDKFRPAWRAYHSRQKAKRAIITTRTGHLMKQEAVFAAAPPIGTMTNSADAAAALRHDMERLQALALFKRPKIRNGQRSSDLRSMEFVARVVCLPPKYVLNMKDGSLADRVARSSMLGGNDVFPRKVGWLGFNRSLKTSRYVSCACCDKFFRFDEFVVHAGIPLSGGTKSRQFLYVVEREDESVLVPYNTFVPDMEFAAMNNALEFFLGELPLPTTNKWSTAALP